MLYTNTTGAWCLYIFPRVNLRVYFRKIFGAEQRLEQNLAHIFGADWSQILIWRRMIPKIHLAQQFGSKDLVKHLCISIFWNYDLRRMKNQISKIRWKFRIFPKTAYFFGTISLAQVLAQLYMNSKNLRRRKIKRFTLADFSILRRNILTIWCFCSFICRKNVALATLQRIWFLLTKQS